MRFHALIAALLVIATTSGAVDASKLSSLTLRKGEQAIRHALLVRTPLGSSANNVLQELREAGYDPNLANYGIFQMEAGGHLATLGKYSIVLDIGSYRSFFPFFITTDVTAYWGFDANQRLIDVRISKSTDGL
jgi:hypothetical protein